MTYANEIMDYYAELVLLHCYRQGAFFLKSEKSAITLMEKKDVLGQYAHLNTYVKNVKVLAMVRILVTLRLQLCQIIKAIKLKETKNFCVTRFISFQVPKYSY